MSIAGIRAKVAALQQSVGQWCAAIIADCDAIDAGMALPPQPPVVLPPPTPVGDVEIVPLPASNRYESSDLSQQTLAVQFKTGASGGGSIAFGEWQSAPTVRTVAVSTTPGDLAKPFAINTGTRVLFAIGVSYPGYITLAPNTVYFVNVANRSADGSPTAGPGEIVNVFIEIHQQS